VFSWRWCSPSEIVRLIIYLKRLTSAACPVPEVSSSDPGIIPTH
jgi:hypothetical protein